MEQSTYGNFNANTNNLDESCKCKQCANRFYRFTQEFIGLNTSINSIEHKLNTYNLRNKQVVWRSMLKEQLDLFKLFNTIIYIPSCPFLQLQHINVQYELLHKQKFPMINSTDVKTNEFLKVFNDSSGNPPKYMTFEQLTLFHDHCIEHDIIRNDIYDEGLYVYNSDIEYLEQCRHKRFPYTFKREYELDKDLYKKLSPSEFLDSFENKWVVNYNIYSRSTRILLNYLDYVYCNSCLSKYHYIECASESFYIQSSIVAIMYNTLCKSKYYNLFVDESMTNFREIVRNKLIEISEEWSLQPFSNNWMGVQYYYKKLGLLPPCLEKAKIPLEHYQNRIFSVLSDAIIGHPKASHGLYRETMDEFSELMANGE